MFSLFNKKPILVEVHGDNWSAFSLTPTATYRDRCLIAALEKFGGVNEATPNGRYHFNAKMLLPFKMAYTLTEIEK